MGNAGMLRRLVDILWRVANYRFRDFASQDPKSMKYLEGTFESVVSLQGNPFLSLAMQEDCMTGHEHDSYMEPKYLCLSYICVFCNPRNR